MKIYRWYSDYADDMHYNKDRFAIVCYHCNNEIDIYENYLCVLRNFQIEYEDIKNLTEDKIKKFLMLKE